MGEKEIVEGSETLLPDELMCNDGGKGGFRSGEGGERERRREGGQRRRREGRRELNE